MAVLSDHVSRRARPPKSVTVSKISISFNYFLRLGVWSKPFTEPRNGNVKLFLARPNIMSVGHGLGGMAEEILGIGPELGMAPQSRRRGFPQVLERKASIQLIELRPDGIRVPSLSV